MKEMEVNLANVTTSCKILKVKFQLDTTKAKEELDTLRVKYDMGEMRIKAILEKHQLTLNWKVEATFARGWNEWAAQPAKLQVF